MDDLKEDLLDTAAVLKEKLLRIEIRSWLLIGFLLSCGPLFYFLLAFAFVKLSISVFLVGYLLQKAFKQIV